MINAVIFDVGDVLTKWSPEEFCASIFPLDLKARKIALEEGFLSPLWYEGDKGTTTMGELAKRMAKEESHAKIIAKAFSSFPDALIPIEDMIALLRKLKANGYGVYLLSNYNEYFLRSISKLGIEKDIDGYVYSYPERITKPNRQIYELLLSRFSLDPSTCLFIDDRKENILGAKEAGIAYTYLYKKDTEKLKEYLVENGIRL